MLFAPIVDLITFTAEGTAGRKNVADLEPIPIYGIIISNTGASGRFSVEMFNGDTSIGEVEVNFATSIPIDTLWFASAGLGFEVTLDFAVIGACSISVFRGNPGT